MSTPARRTVLVLGAGPGLGMSIAQRFGREGFAVALVSRSAARHDDYVDALAANGVEAAAFAADIADAAQLAAVLKEVTARFGPVDVAYYGPAGPADMARDITEISATDARSAMDIVHAAVDVVAAVLPAMQERGSGGLLFAGGLSGKVPMPGLGALVLASAALRQYALTLNAALAPKGIYAGTLTIGGLIERGDIHAMITADPEQFGDLGAMTLNPDDIAEEAWKLYTTRDRAEETFSAFG